MANPGGVGNKFVSVNLNKSYGQPSHHHNHHHPPSSGLAAGNRVRPVNHGGGGGGMVVLSRPRSSQKAMPKLSVPSPLNLPSLRKEHERFDLSGSGGGSGGGGASSGSGSRPNSSGVGWTRPGTVTSQERDGSGDSQVADGVDQSLHATTGVNRGSSTYTPPLARMGGVGLPVTASAQAYPLRAEKAMVLRGEDFPSLKASLPATAGPVQKQKDSSQQKQKQIVTEEASNEQRDSYQLSSPIRMRPHGQSSHPTMPNELNENGGEGHRLGSSRVADQARKKELFPGPLPLVRLNPRSDWADDERDTGHGFADRSRGNGFPKSEAYWDREFDMPRSSILPHKPPNNLFERRGQHGEDTGKGSSNEVLKVDSYRRDVITPSREGDTWRTSPLQKDGFNVQEVANDRNGIGRLSGLNRDTGKENKYIPPPLGDNSWDGRVTGNQDSAFVRRDMGHGKEGRQHWNHTVEPFSSPGAERHTRDRYGTEQSSRYRGHAFQSTVSKSSYSSGRLTVNDPILNFGREKRAFSKGERPYVEDPVLKDFSSAGYDERDPFSGGNVGVIKRKKDVVKQADFHDPIRESFEAELERVQKMQEMERQRIIEEQERALEQTRREEEERNRLIREEEERRKRLEEEAQEAAWRAEQERLEVIRKAEEQKIAREEEKRRLFIEEERRKQAAKLKLLELEARIARRQAETTKSESIASAVADEEVSVHVKEKDVSRAVDMDNWEDSERMVERITTSASSDSSAVNRSFEMSSRLHPSREGSSVFVDRGKPVNLWRRDVFENGNSSSFQLQEQENGHHSPRRDAPVGGRAFPGKEFYGGAGYVPSRAYFRGGMQEPHMEELSHLKEHRWNTSGDGNPYNKRREIETDFYENVAEKYGDVEWGQGRSHGNPRYPYPERLYPNSEADELYAYGRSRYSMRQPRVPPPPSLASIHKTSFRGETEHPGRSTSLENGMHYYNDAGRSESTLQTGYYCEHEEKPEPSALVDVRQENTMNKEQKLDKNTTPRCYSQSSLSVSSPPSSPTPLSHDELDDSGDSPVIPAATEGKEIPMPGNEFIDLNDKSGKDTMMTASSSISASEDEEWTLENNEELQEQEEYDEDEDGYQEEDEVHEVYDENVDLTQEFGDMRLEEKVSSHMDNLVLGFDEGVEVGIQSDEFERNSRSEEKKFGIPEVSIGIVEEHGSVDGIQGDVHGLQPVDGSPQMSIASSSRRINETEKAIQDSIIQPINDPHTLTASDLVDSVDASGGSGPSVQHIVPTAVDMPSHSATGPTIMSPVSSVPVPSQTDLPVKLQFGLFSGPPLIPSPVQAIQIGSIQMPLNLHSPLGPSIGHIHPSQTPLFQFGQLRYTSPISPGILPVAPQSMSFIQPNIQPPYLNQNSGGSLPMQPRQDNSVHVTKDDVPSLSGNNQPGVVSRAWDLSLENGSRGLNSFFVRESAESNALIHKSQTEISHAVGKEIMSEPGSQTEDKKHHDAVVRKYVSSSDGKGPKGQMQAAPASSQSISSEKYFSMSKSEDTLSGRKGKFISYPVRNSGLKSSFPVSEASRSHSSGFQRRSRRPIQRTEFRVRGSIDKGQPSGLVSSSNTGLDNKSDLNGKGVGIFTNELKQGAMSTKALRQIAESENSSSGPIISQEIASESRAGKGIAKEALPGSHSISASWEGNLKRNISEEDVDAPLQSGIVRVFKQPGIEAPSDEDDFIEVRSKRQMLNDRREQREKEIKAKSRVTKPPRKPHSSAQSTVVSTSSTKFSASLGEAPNSIRSDFIVSEGRGLVNKEVSTGFSSMVSQPLAPIGTPAANTDAQADIKSHAIKSLQTGSVPVRSLGGRDLGPSVIYETKNKVLDNGQTALCSWGNARINRQVMALTQTQLDEAMKPARFNSHVTSIGGHTTSVSEPILPSSSILTKDKSISSSASPINSLLAGEKIQFGAVTSPTVLPPGSHVSHGIGAPGSFRSDIQISHNLSSAESACTLFFEKDQLPNESCVRLEDCEAEAEAAASAVAVAAISNDEIVVNVGAVAVSDTKSFRGADLDGISGGGVAGDQQSGSQSRAEESLSVSLPADLSVETPPISLWPPLPSPQNSSNQIFSHFPGAPPPHFPFYEMNPMLGGPIFAFGPHEESGGTHSQSQKSTMSGSGHLGTWQQCHSTVDSFYGPPAGFTGPFISPPGGIPGVQAPPHMVVYNHYTPVGQFGQVGLSFMGTTYIPSGKQPDWKHNPTSSAMGIGEGDMNNTNMVSAQRNPPNMPAAVQHLAPGSPLLPMASPLAMFDASPFQSATDMPPVQARWSHLHSVPLSLPLQQQTEGVLPSQFSHGHPVEQSLTANRFSESQTSTPSDSGLTFPVVTEATVTQFPDQLGLVNSSSSTVAGVSTQVVNNLSSSAANAGKSDALQNGSSDNSNGQSTNAFKTRHSQQYNQPTGYSYQRGGGSQKNSSAGEWSHRRMGFHGRNQSLGAEKNFPSSKIKQIYVAKQAPSGNFDSGMSKKMGLQEYLI